MNKININKIYIIAILFIALLPNISMAVAEGSGTFSDPYIIGTENGSNTIVYSEANGNFYFKVLREGTYHINHEAATQTITFNFVADDELSKVANNAMDYNRKQLGVETAPDTSGGNVTPKYKITDESRYLYYDDSNDKYQLGTMGLPLTNAFDEKNRVQEDYYFFTRSQYAEQEYIVFDPLFKSGDGYVPREEIGNYYMYFSDNGKLYIPMGKSDDEKLKIALQENQGELGAPYGTTYAVNAIYNFNIGFEEEEKAGNWIEEQITRILETVGDKFLEMIRAVLGKNLSIDTLIFNEFDDTKIDLYKKSDDNSTDDSEVSINNTLRTVINTWFDIFSNIVYVGYIIVLVYIGISIIAASGTAKQNKAKESLINWLVGLIILMLFPRYGIPLIIDINDALVSYIGKGRREYKTYYNLYEELPKFTSDGVIYGSDSTTTSIDNLIASRDEARQALMNSISGEKQKAIDEVVGLYMNDPSFGMDSWNEDQIQFLEEVIDYYIHQLQLTFELNNGEISDEVLQKAKDRFDLNYTWMTRSTSANFDEETKRAIANKLLDPSLNNKMLEYAESWYEIYKKYEDEQASVGAVAIDIMGTMRAMSGKYHKLIYTIIWIMLIFQMIGLTFLYYKRLFVIAILIAVFPFIMLFYCIDKMADGSAQTLKLWFKEFLANVFIQTIHAVIYRVLVEMGITVYEDTNNWIFLVAAMLMLLPAEALLKEIFGLNGSTVRQVGGMFQNAIRTAYTALHLKNIWKGRNDASEVQKREARYNKIQQKQDRADAKARTREAQELALHPENLKSDGSVEFTGKRAKQQAKYDAQTAKREKQVERLNHRGVGDAVRIAKNVAAVTMGAAYGIAAGDLASGVQTANLISGATGTKKTQRDENGDKKDLKRELKVAYSRKNNKS